MRANAKNTIFATVAAWPDWKEKTHVIRRSAERYGIDLLLVGAGDSWKNYYENKIVALREWLMRYRTARPEVHYLVFVDARDAVFVKQRDEIIELLEDFDEEKVTFNTDRRMVTWTVRAHWFAQRISLKYGMDGIANSGLYAGRIDRVLEMYDQCIALKRFFNSKEQRPGTVEGVLKQAIRDDGGPFTIARYARSEQHFESDQFYIQLLQAQWSDLIAVDIERRVFAGFSDGWPTLANWQSNGTMPLGTAGILHSPWMFHREKMTPENVAAWEDWARRERII